MSSTQLSQMAPPDNIVPDTHQKALAMNLDPTSFGSFAEIGAGQEVARWFLRVGAASGTVAKTVSAYDKSVSDDLYGAGTRYVSKPRLDAMLDREWASLMQQVGQARSGATRLFAFADTVAARNFAGTNDCHGWIGVRFQDRPGAEPSDVLLHVNLRDTANVAQQEAVGILGVNLLHALLCESAEAETLIVRLFDNLAENRIEVDEIVLRGAVFTACDATTLHALLARDGRAEAVMCSDGGAAIAANELLYKKAVVISTGSDDCGQSRSTSMAESCAELLRAEIDGDADIKDVVSARLVVVEPELTSLARRPGVIMMTRHRQLHRVTSIVRRYTSAPLCFAMPLPELMRIFDDARYQPLEGQLLDGISRLFASGVRVLAYAASQEDLRGSLDTDRGRGWEAHGNGPYVAADQLRPGGALRHLYEYLLASGFLVSMPAPL